MTALLVRGATFVASDVSLASAPSQIAAADVDGDGANDLVVGDWDGAGAAVL